MLFSNLGKKRGSFVEERESRRKNRVSVEERERERRVGRVVGGGFNASERCLIFQHHLFLVL